MLSPRTFTVLFTLALLTGCVSTPEDRSPEAVESSQVTVFSGNRPDSAMPKGWHAWKFSRFKKPTAYRLVNDAGRTVVKASASASASGLIHPLRLDPSIFPFLSWRWKVDELIANADNTRKDTEDSPVRILVSFDGDIDSLPLDERMLFDNIRLATGRQLPYATLVYIWENRALRDSVIPNLHTSRIKMIVAESGRDKLGAWQQITRNVVEDFKRAFGEAPGRITAVAIMTDTDNTGTSTHAYYGDIAFGRAAPPHANVAIDENLWD